MATPTPGGAKTNLGLEPNIAGLLCYVPCCIGLVFSIVAAIVEKGSRSVRFHAFQSLLLHGVMIVLWIGLTALQMALGAMGLYAVNFLVWIVGMVVGVGLLALTILLMIKAHSGEEMELPAIGPMARQWV